MASTATAVVAPGSTTSSSATVVDGHLDGRRLAVAVGGNELDGGSLVGLPLPVVSPGPLVVQLVGIGIDVDTDRGRIAGKDDRWIGVDPVDDQRLRNFGPDSVSAVEIVDDVVALQTLVAGFRFDGTDVVETDLIVAAVVVEFTAVTNGRLLHLAATATGRQPSASDCQQCPCHHRNQRTTTHHHLLGLHPFASRGHQRIFDHPEDFNDSESSWTLRRSGAKSRVHNFKDCYHAGPVSGSSRM